MYTIKQIPEDFVVREISSLSMNPNGKYSYYKLKKTRLTTMQAVERVTKTLKVNLKYLNFAGTKDKHAVTTQFVSISQGPEKGFSQENLTLTFVGKGNQRLNLGMLQGNSFEITIRNINKRPRPVKRTLNLFDEQRFGMSRNNHFVGKLLLQRRYSNALEMISGKKPKSRDYISTLREIPRKTLMMYIHSYQSHLWNLLAEKRKNSKTNIQTSNLYKTTSWSCYC